jgi:hypothetical protein
MAQTFPAATPSAPAPKKGKGVLIGILLMLLGFFGGIVLVVLGIINVANTLNAAPSMNVPGQGTIPLDAGNYVLYSDVLLSSSAVTISGPSGPVTPSTLYSTQTFERGSHTLDGFASITIPTTGSYQFNVRGTSSSSGLLVVGPNAFGVVGVALIFVLGGIFGGLFLFFVGLIVLIVGLVRRSKAKRPVTPAAPYGGPGGPGAYPQPAYGQPGPTPPPGPAAYPQPGAPPPSPYPQAPQPGPPQPGPPPYGPPPGAPPQ